jgi:L-ascorbate metabolism protein UlaG (beta-lactamase superfamily)
MVVLDGLDLDYAFFCCDGIYNMDVAEASECAKMVNAKHSIPYHTDDASKSPFKAEVAEAFEAKGKIILKPGEKIEL